MIEVGSGSPGTGRAASRTRRVARAAGGVWRRIVPGDGVGARPPIRLAADARILVLMLQQVGDSLMVSPVIAAVRARYPAATIDLLATPVGYEVYKRSPHVRRIHVVQTPKGGRSAYRTAAAWAGVIRRIRGIRYDCVLACVNHVSTRYVLAAVASGARHLVGFDDGPAGFLFTRRLTSRAGQSVLRNNLALAEAIDAETRAGEEFWFEAEDSARTDRLLAAHGVVPDTRLVVLHPGSNWQSKTWFPDRWAALADRLSDEEGLYPVFVGAGRDVEAARTVQSMMRSPSVSLAGETDLCQLGALMARADLVIGTDSGPRHVAGALRRPQVTIMSSLDEPWRWGLDRDREVVLRSDPECRGCMQSTCSHRRCLDLIPVDRVSDACRDLLHRASATRARRIPTPV